MNHPSSHIQRQRRPRSPHRGFTMVELLITSVIMGVIFATGSNVMVTQIRVSSQQESLRRLQDHWGRINHMLDSEITESAAATAVPGTSLTLTLAGGQTITYAYDGSTRTMTRTGPPINDNGTLNLASGTANVSSVLLTNVDAFSPTLTNSREPAYTLALSDGLGASLTGLSSSSRSRTSSYP